MIYLQLFLTFLKIGAFTFGGGYAMLPLIQEEVLGQGWMGMEDLVNFVAVSESTPGPLAVNLSTYIGAETAGFWGAVCATFGVCAALLRHYSDCGPVLCRLPGERHRQGLHEWPAPRGGGDDRRVPAFRGGHGPHPGGRMAARWQPGPCCSWPPSSPAGRTSTLSSSSWARRQWASPWATPGCWGSRDKKRGTGYWPGVPFP